LLLQQRHTFSHTRLKVDIETLHEQSAGVLTETELQEDWVFDALQAQPNAEPNEVIEQAILSFNEWLDADDKRRRKLLQHVSQHADLRREARSESQRRFR
jgi:CBS-domain-containing membrane protein